MTWHALLGVCDLLDSCRSLQSRRAFSHRQTHHFGIPDRQVKHTISQQSAKDDIVRIPLKANYWTCHKPVVRSLEPQTIWILLQFLVCNAGGLHLHNGFWHHSFPLPKVHEILQLLNEHYVLSHQFIEACKSQSSMKDLVLLHQAQRMAIVLRIAADC